MSKQAGALMEYDAVLAPLSRVSDQESLRSLTERLMEIRQWLSDDLSSIEALFAEIREEQNNVAQSAGAHLLSQSGKRIRSLCVLLSTKMGEGANPEHTHRLAIACELVHAATLLHDDVLDEGDIRRGAPASRVLFGNSVSILAGDHLLIEALKQVESTEQYALLRSLLETIGQMVEAEAIQLERRGRFDPSRDTYLKVIDGKTAGLFRWGLQAGATLGGLSDEAVHHIGEVGHALGMAFQVTDDILDLTGDPTTMGKESLSDLREGKLTLPIVIACEKDDVLRASIQRFVESNDDTISPADIVARLHETGAFETARTYAREQTTKVQEHLNHLPEGKARNALAAVVEGIVDRVS